jgi:hypothetical protein
VKQEHRILVCGGRAFGELPPWILSEEELEEAIALAEKERALLVGVLDRLNVSMNIQCIINGGAKGADRLARVWAGENEVKQLTFPADWDKYKKAAGFIRNKQMLVEGKPTLVIAFPGGPGTRNMVEQATKAGVPVYEVKYENV